MPIPSCCGHKNGGGTLGPIWSERRMAPSPRRKGPCYKARWPDSRLFEPPSDAPCTDLIGASIWDPLQSPLRQGAWFPGSAPRPDKAPPPRSKCKESAQRRATARPNHPDRNTIFTPDDSRGSVLGSQVTFPDCRQRPVSDSAGEDKDPPPGYKVWGRPCPGASPKPLPLTLPVNKHRQTDGCCDFCGSICGKSGVKSGNQGHDGPRGLPPGRVWTRNRRMQSGGQS